MSNIDIKIDDDYYKSMGDFFSKKCEELQVGIDQYITILDNILKTAIMEGDTADALDVFLSYAKCLSGIIKPVGEECKGLCDNYLLEIDVADSELY